MVSHTKRRSKLARAVENVCRMEPLEDRQMLTTLNGGDVFLYKDSKSDIFRITVLGNTQAEFVGAAVDANNNVTLGDLAPSDATNGVDLFAIYVAQGDWDSVITIEKVTIDNNSGRITPDPFNGSVTLNVTNARDGRPLQMTTGANTGSGYLGARTVAVNGQNNSADQPILSANLAGQIGVLPTDTGPWSAGLVVADGQDLGRFLFDGTITGNVDVAGSMNLFYAGQILTGDARGEFISSLPAAFPNNFNIDGDLRDLVVSGSIGTDTAANSGPGDDPTYLTRFQMRVGGHLGQVHVADAFYGTVDANDQDRYFHDEPQTEIESRGTFGTFAEGFLNDTLGNGDDQFQNDNFNTPQYLGTLQDGIVVDGELDAIARANFNDFTDYYGVALMAGQTVTVQLTDTTFLGFPGGPTDFPNLVNIGVYDPDGRLIATDYSDVDPTALLGKPFQFTADRPGVYRFAIAEEEDADFNGPGGEFTRPGHIGVETYELSITGAGNMAVGAVSAGSNVMDPELASNGFVAHNGDMGAILAGGSTIFQFKTGDLLSTDPVDVFSIVTEDGSLRTVEANEVGRLLNGEPTEGPGLSIANGNVGLLRSRTGVLSVNESLLGSDLTGTTGIPLLFPTPDVPRNYQVVDAATRFLGVLLADQKIGIVRAGDMATLDPSIFHVNDDNFGDDGVIDLIDVAGNFGTLRGGGPHITTGPKGNVRYINVGGNLFRDEAFGGGQPDLTPFSAGQTATITDDSGAILRISPGSTSSLGILTYGIRGSGGSAIVRIETTASVNIKSSTRANSSPAEIGHILTTGTGPNMVQDPVSGRILLDPAYVGTNVSLDIAGKSRVDVYTIEGSKFTHIINSTPGEIVTVMGESIGILQAQNLGTPMQSTPAAIVGRTILAPGAAYPYLDQTTGILVADIVQAKSNGQIGNLIVSQPLVALAIQNLLFDPRLVINVTDNFGSIERLNANANNKPLGNAFEGITGPVLAQQPLATPPPNSGHIGDVSIGAGILPSGTGNLARAGLFADGRIGTVRGKKTADIRGNIISRNSVGRIDLVNGGSIINSNIEILATLADAREFDNIRATVGDNDSVETPTFEIGQITLTGDAKGRTNPRRPKPQFRGGIIGSFISAPDIGPTILKGGSFGIINSAYSVPGAGVMSKFQTDGYGLRDVIITAGARVGDMIAQGNGSSLSSRVFTDDVRQSETTDIDPFFQFAPNALTDIHKFLGTSKNTPTLSGITDTGIIAGVSVQASRDLNSLVAWKVVGNSDSEPATFNFANHIKKIQVAQDMFNVDIITGQLDKFTVGHDVINLNMTVAGPIGTISIGHDYDIRSRIHAIGNDGTIDSIFVGHDLDGNMSAENTVGKLKVNGLYNGDVTANGVRVPRS